ncbi:unnamed protein product, partial [Coregonus sp. 'balchen']
MQTDGTVGGLWREVTLLLSLKVLLLERDREGESEKGGERAAAEQSVSSCSETERGLQQSSLPRHAARQREGCSRAVCLVTQRDRERAAAEQFCLVMQRDRERAAAEQSVSSCSETERGCSRAVCLVMQRDRERAAAEQSCLVMQRDRERAAAEQSVSSCSETERGLQQSSLSRHAARQREGCSRAVCLVMQRDRERAAAEQSVCSAHLRSVDVKILQQLLAVHEGIEACKWLLEERGTLTSRCSSLTSSQYSLGEGPGGDTWRGSWSSLHDPLNDKLDNISIGSYLDTLADDMDEYCPSSSESVLCSTPLGTATPTRTGGGTGAGAVPGAGAGAEPGAGAGRGAGAGAVEGSVPTAGVGVGAGVGPGTGSKVVVDPGFPQVKPDIPKESPIWTKATEAVKGTTITKDTKDPSQTQQPSKSNGVLEKAVRQAGGPADSAWVCLAEKLGKSHSPKLKPYKNGKIDLDACKMNSKMHL